MAIHGVERSLLAINALRPSTSLFILLLALDNTVVAKPMIFPCRAGPCEVSGAVLRCVCARVSPSRVARRSPSRGPVCDDGGAVSSKHYPLPCRVNM